MDRIGLWDSVKLHVRDRLCPPERPPAEDAADWPVPDRQDYSLLVRRFVFDRSGRMLERRTMRMPTSDNSYAVYNVLALEGCRRVDVWMDAQATTYNKPTRIRWERVNW